MSGALASIKSKASSGLNKAKSVVGIETQTTQETTMEDLAEGCPQLTYQQRLYGFGSCFIIGYLITFMSFRFFTDLINGRPIPFVIVYTLGNIISLFSSMFLCGPKRQFKNMFDKKRKEVTIIYLSTLFLSIVVCFITFNKDIKLLILVLLLIVQCLSSIWYSLSYIPLARRAVKKCFKKNFADEGV